MTKAFRFNKTVKTFRNFQLGPLSLDLEPGTVLGYVGPNGSGKTTTMRCLAGLLKTDSGTMEVFGRGHDPDNPDWKKDIGYVGDNHAFYERWTGARNLEFQSQFYQEWRSDRVVHLARRFEVPLDRKVKHLSTGNRIKLAIISALAHSPRLLLLDEPTAGLDPVVRTEVLDVLFELLEDGKRSIFYSTHILSDISRLADELAFIRDGKLVFRSAKDDLIENWRKISFRHNDDLNYLYGTVGHVREGQTHQVITADREKTLAQLRGTGAQNIEENRMSMDEIAVQILKGGDNVAAS